MQLRFIQTVKYLNWYFLKNLKDSLTLAALGVVFGDIATSPIYALRECFSQKTDIALNSANILGVLSIIFWSLIIIISIKYVLLVLKADNHGEGGILALLTVIKPSKVKRSFIFPIGLFGAALLIGDGMITPAISVLSAVEGLSLISPDFDSFVIPLALLILFLLFFFQKEGSQKIGVTFGIIVSIWLIVLFWLGITQILQEPHVLKALNPKYMFYFLKTYKLQSLAVLGSSFLVVTGGEALYADLGHFGRKVIRKAWFLFVLPALVVNYFGQGALLLQNSADITNPFFLMAPHYLLPALVILATAATIIASQAVISGVFSLAHQAIQLEILPRIQMIHTSSRQPGQIYSPPLNWLLWIATSILVLGFKTSSDLAAAYGIAVSLTMIITSYLGFKYLRQEKTLPSFVIFLGFIFFLTIDIVYFGANILKFPDGGWFPIFIASLVFIIVTTWKSGKALFDKHNKKNNVKRKEYFADFDLKHVNISPGSAVHFSSDITLVPQTFLANFKRNNTIHLSNIFITYKTIEKPYVPNDERICLNKISSHFYEVSLKYGFRDNPEIENVMELLRPMLDIEIHIDETLFFVGSNEIHTEDPDSLSFFKKKLFAFLSRNTLTLSKYLSLPPSQVVEIGGVIEI